MADDMSNYYLPKTQTFVELDCTAAFNNLTDQEKLYAHYLTQVRLELVLCNLCDLIICYTLFQNEIFKMF